MGGSSVINKDKWIKNIFALIFLLFGLTLTFIIINFNYEFYKTLSDGVEQQGLVVDIKNAKDPDDPKKYRLIIEYEVDGKIYELDKQHPSFNENTAKGYIGKEFTIVYRPDTPGQWSVPKTAMKSLIFFSIFTIVICLLFTSFASLMLFAESDELNAEDFKKYNIDSTKGVLLIDRLSDLPGLRANFRLLEKNWINKVFIADMGTGTHLKVEETFLKSILLPLLLSTIMFVAYLINGYVFLKISGYPLIELTVPALGVLRHVLKKRTLVLFLSFGEKELVIYSDLRIIKMIRARDLENPFTFNYFKVSRSLIESVGFANNTKLQIQVRGMSFKINQLSPTVIKRVGILLKI